MDERDKQIEEYRKKDLIVLLNIRLKNYASYEKSTINQVIFEKAKALQAFARGNSEQHLLDFTGGKMECGIHGIRMDAAERMIKKAIYNKKYYPINT